MCNRFSESWRCEMNFRKRIFDHDGNIPVSEGRARRSAMLTNKTRYRLLNILLVLLLFTSCISCNARPAEVVRTYDER